MAVGTESQRIQSAESDDPNTPAVASCESRPGKIVLLEEDNTDGWIASDTTEEITR